MRKFCFKHQKSISSGIAISSGRHFEIPLYAQQVATALPEVV